MKYKVQIPKKSRVLRVEILGFSTTEYPLPIKQEFEFEVPDDAVWKYDAFAHLAKQTFIVYVELHSTSIEKKIKNLVPEMMR
jgi:hypothetical protein